MRRLVGRVLRRCGLLPIVRRFVVVSLDRVGVVHSFWTEDLVDGARRLLQRSHRRFEVPKCLETGCPVLFFSVRGVGDHIPHATGVLWHAIRARGDAAVVVVCDGGLPACETCTVSESGGVPGLLRDGPDGLCASCHGRTREFLDAMEVPWIPFSALLTSEMRTRAQDASRTISDLNLDQILSTPFGGLDMSEHLRSSLYRYYLVGEIDDSDETRAVARRYWEACALVSMITRAAIDRYQPRCLVSHHGIYAVGGISCAVARQAGVRIAAWDGGYRRGSVLFSHGGTYHRELVTEPVSIWEGMDFDNEKRAVIDEYLTSRRSGSRDWVSYHPNPIESKQAITETIGLRNDERLVVAFTNIAWDGRVNAPDLLFAGPVEWALAIVDRLGNVEGVRLVVRIHPAEVKGLHLARQKTGNEILSAFKQLPRNVVVVMPEDDMSSYVLAELADLAVVYSSKIGLEVATMGTPVVVAGDAFYGKKGLTIQPESAAEYLDAIADPDLMRPLSGEQRTRALQYAYHYFFRRMIQIPGLLGGGLGAAPVARTVLDFAHGASRELDVVVDGLLYGTPFVLEDASAKKL